MGTEQYIERKVADVSKRDFGHGKIRMDDHAMRKLGIETGDYVEIHAKKMTVAVAWLAYAEDGSRKIARIDEFVRENAGAALNENIRVRRAVVKDAEAIVFAPTDAKLNIDELFLELVKRQFMLMPFVEGDVALLSNFGNTARLKVTKTRPQEAVRIAEATKVRVLSEPPLVIKNINR
jgi:transitional endoplasmic reticulum ATPase